VIDLFDRKAYIESQRTKQDIQVAGSLIRSWKVLGPPDYLQLDNELSFRGSNRHPRSFGLVIKSCLHFGVQPVFIPISEPWRNGVVEKFNDTYNKKFFRRQWFNSYATKNARARISKSIITVIIAIVFRKVVRLTNVGQNSKRPVLARIQNCL
jgi:putative transposase